jgi:hypothetical protein
MSRLLTRIVCWIYVLSSMPVFILGSIIIYFADYNDDIIIENNNSSFMYFMYSWCKKL